MVRIVRRASEHASSGDGGEAGAFGGAGRAPRAHPAAAGGTGVEAKEVRRRTGWIVRFGPVEATDIPAYLAAGKQKTDAMRHVRFGTRARLEMAAAWATPIALLATALWWSHAAALWGLIWGVAVAVFLGYDRLPLHERLRRPAVAVAAIAAVTGILAATGALTAGRMALWSAITVVVVGMLTFDHAGSSPMAASGFAEERQFRVVLDLERCTGAYNCWAVCPEACFDKLPSLQKVAITHSDRCIRCGACIVQCPQDALAFETPDGWRVEPDQIRRFKLDMLGRRAKHVGAAQA